MRPTRKRLLKAALITLIGAAVIIAAAGPIISSIVNKKIKDRLEASDIRFASFSVNFFTRSIKVEDLEWGDKARIKNVHARGIGILSLFRDKKINVRRVSFTDGSVNLNLDSLKTLGKDNGSSIKIKGLDIDRLMFDNIDVTIKKDSTKEYTGKLQLSFSHFTLDSAKAFQFRNVETTVRDLRISKKGSLSEIRIKYAAFDKEQRTAHIDSLQLLPLLNKTEFAKTVKSSSATRTTLVVASVDASGVNMGVDSSIMVSSIHIEGPMIHAYKNKKYPFTRKEKIPLPMEMFEALHLGIEADTVKIHHGNITYEELPVEGFNYAWIQFEDVEATMIAVGNREYKNMPDYTTLEATAHVMKTGQVKATFMLPLGSKKRYSAEGTITNVPLKELNPLLKDLAFIEISSGKLNKLDFKFTYDDIGSKGVLHFDYEDLKILGLKKEREKDVNQFKTLLINTAVKNDETLTGNINVVRNQRKAVFNLWAASLADGIGNALMPRRNEKKGKQK